VVVTDIQWVAVIVILWALWTVTQWVQIVIRWVVEVAIVIQSAVLEVTAIQWDLIVIRWAVEVAIVTRSVQIVIQSVVVEVTDIQCQQIATQHLLIATILVLLDLILSTLQSIHHRPTTDIQKRATKIPTETKIATIQIHQCTQTQETLRTEVNPSIAQLTLNRPTTRSILRCILRSIR
jgi:hypothetical protein